MPQRKRIKAGRGSFGARLRPENLWEEVFLAATSWPFQGVNKLGFLRYWGLRRQKKSVGGLRGGLRHIILYYPSGSGAKRLTLTSIPKETT